jgi:alkaline phosphatase D
MAATLIGRRTLLAGTAALLTAPAVLRSQILPGGYPFRLGIASGDPASDGFVIWTRLAPEPLAEHGGMPMQPVPVQWQVAADDRFRTIVRSGEAIARPELAHSVHVEVQALESGRPYWYRFAVGREVSPTGRSRTAPAPDTRLDKMRIGVAGCQHFEQGLFTTHRHLSGEELEFVFHYGDYIYEARPLPFTLDAARRPIPVVRSHVGQEIYSLDDYRRRYAQYKTDIDLQAAHAAAPWFVTYDDHEVYDNWTSESGAIPREAYLTRRAGALQAWYEHMPVRAASFPKGGAMTMHRAARYGDLLHAHFLDTRQYRTTQGCSGGVKPACSDVRSPGAAMLGNEQEQWLSRELADKSAAWNLIAQQIMVMDLDRRTGDEPEPTYSMDTWAGYAAPRRRLLDRFKGLGNVVVLTGDEHQNFAGELVLDGKPVAAEFVVTSISSAGDGQDLRPGGDRLLARNAPLKFINSQRGYVTCDIGREEWRTNFMVLDQVQRPGGSISRRATFSVARGDSSPRLV